MKNLSYTFLLVILLITKGTAQQPVSVPFSSSLWDTENAEFIPATFQGVEGILLTRGIFFLKDMKFLNGVIDVDINFSNRRNFPGIRFRMQDIKNCESFYIRPHQSGNPDANQYTPVFNGTAGWQLYHGKQWGSPVTYTFDQWHHLRIVVSGSTADIYFDDMLKPALSVDLLREPESGSIGIATGIAPVYFANFSYTLEHQRIPPTPVKSRAEPTAITKWDVSEVISDSVLQEKYSLDKNFRKSMNWKTYESEVTGLINLARYAKRSPGNNTVVVKVDIGSDKQQFKKLNFGFSDRVRVYLNSKAIYEGEDRFRSRDYRYLGTIGYFDTLILPLRKGANELLFVVGENMGGWGLQAKFDDLEGIRLN